MSTATLEHPVVIEKSTELPLLADLILVRLLASSAKPPVPSAVRKHLNAFFRHPPTTEAWQQAIAELRDEKLLDPKKMLATETGTLRAKRFLDAPNLSEKATWQTLRNKFLVAKIMELKGIAVDRDRLGDYESLATQLLKNKFGITVGKTFTQVFTAWACQTLGLPESDDWGMVRRIVLSGLLGSAECLSNEQLKRNLPRVKLNARQGGAEGLRKALFTAWTAGEAQSSPTPIESHSEEISEQFDLGDFAHTVRSAVRHCPTGRLGDNKVFINHLWRFLQEESSFPRLDLAAFKEKLVEANARHLLVLSRADMAPDMPQTDVQESETHYLNARFHFVTLEEPRP